MHRITRKLKKKHKKIWTERLGYKPYIIKSSINICEGVWGCMTKRFKNETI